MKKIILVLGAVFIWWPSLVVALGVEANPAHLKLVTNSQGRVETVLTIANPSTEPGLFALSIDDHQSWFKIEPAELRLEAGERRAVKISIKADKSGQYSTWLSVVGYPLDTRAFKAGSGVKIPLNLSVSEIKTYWPAYIIGGVALSLILAGLYLAFYSYNRRENQANFPGEVKVL